jgi:hypothetical protein
MHLRGKVDSGEAKAAAAEIATGIEGAKSVKNDLQVVSPRPQGGRRQRQGHRQGGRVAHVQGRQPEELGVRTHGGVVTPDRRGVEHHGGGQGLGAGPDGSRREIGEEQADRSLV